MSGNKQKKKQTVTANKLQTAEAVVTESVETPVQEPDVNAVEDADIPEIEEIQEFVVASDAVRSERKKAERASVSAVTTWSPGQKSAAVLVAFVVLALVYVWIGIKICTLNPVVVCVILLIQVAIGVLLDQNPVWLHACIVAADIVAGMFVGQTWLMVAAAVVYVAAIVSLEALQRIGMIRKS